MFFSGMISTARQEYDKARELAEQNGTSAVTPYIDKLISKTKELNKLVQRDPSFGKTALEAAELVIKEGYPPEYIDMNWDKLVDFYAADNCGQMNVYKEVVLSRQMCKLMNSIIKANPSLKMDVYSAVSKLPDCREKAYFSGVKSSEAC